MSVMGQAEQDMIADGGTAFCINWLYIGQKGTWENPTTDLFSYIIYDTIFFNPNLAYSISFSSLSLPVCPPTS